jgi:predicted transglutaminase-like cysteine proteinase
LGLLLAFALGVSISACSTTPDPSSPLPLGLPTAAPAGYVQLCARDARQCPQAPNAGLQSAAYQVPQASRALTPERWALLTQVNREVNQRVRYESDEDRFGQPDVWLPAVDAGDCEDYALAKRQLLWAAGWSPEELSLALVQSPATGAHAVLVASTAQGAYVLDNANGWVLPWSATDYTWVTAQDADGQWRVAGPNAQAVLLAAAVAGRQRVAHGQTQQVASLRSPPEQPGGEAPLAKSSGQIPDVSALEPGSR